MNCYNNRKNEQNVNTCYISSLNDFTFELNQGSLWKYLFIMQYYFDINPWVVPPSRSILQSVHFSKVPIVVDWSVEKNCSCAFRSFSIDISTLPKYVVPITLDSLNWLNWCISALCYVRQCSLLCYLVTLIFHLGYHFMYYLLLSLLYTRGHLWVPLIPKINQINNDE